MENTKVIDTYDSDKRKSSRLENFTTAAINSSIQNEFLSYIRENERKLILSNL